MEESMEVSMDGSVGESREEELETLVHEYQAALRAGDEATLLRLFHPTAFISYPEGNELRRASAAKFVAEVAAMVAGGQVVDETTRRLSIERAGAVASVRVDFHLQLDEDHYEGTDFYALARLGDGWQITQKLYAMAPAEP
jgi:hypothetical protein